MALYPGSVVRVSGAFLNADTRQGVDAAGVKLVVLKPSGKRDEYVGDALTRTAPGRYYMDVQIDESGRWQYRWQAGNAADQGEFQVERSAFV